MATPILQNGVSKLVIPEPAVRVSDSLKVIFPYFAE
jgi:hypothetical protein